MDRVDTRIAADRSDGPDGPGRRQSTSPPRYRSPKRLTGIGPAMTVLGVAMVILLVFAIAAAVTNGGNPTATPSRPDTPVKVPGTSLLAIPAARALKGIEQSGLPPANIVRAVSVPVGADVVSNQSNNAGRGQYDEQVVLSVHASQLDVFDFFAAQMPAWHWSVFSKGPAQNEPGTIEVLGKQAGDDGWFWEMGAVVSPTTFGGQGLGTTQGSAGESTRFVIRLFQVSDEE
jgi:hypothetical protein